MLIRQKRNPNPKTQVKNLKVRKIARFTLLEILITMLILGSALTALSVQGVRLIREERFERASEIVSDQIDFAHELLLLYQRDFLFTLKLQPEGLLCSYELIGVKEQEMFTKKIARPLLIKGVENLFLDGEKKETIAVIFSKDHISRKMEITLASRDKRKTFVLQRCHEE